MGGGLTWAKDKNGNAVKWRSIVIGCGGRCSHGDDEGPDQWGSLVSGSKMTRVRPWCGSVRLGDPSESSGAVRPEPESGSSPKHSVTLDWFLISIPSTLTSE